MPIYYFHIHNDDVTIDEEGIDLRDHASAVEYGIQAARSLAAADVSLGRLTLSDRIVVEDENHKLVRELRFEDAVLIRQ
jgi:hypothetical protein